MHRTSPSLVEGHAVAAGRRRLATARALAPHNVSGGMSAPQPIDPGTVAVVVPVYRNAATLADPRVAVTHLPRNVGQHRALLHGCSRSRMRDAGVPGR